MKEHVIDRMQIIVREYDEAPWDLDGRRPNQKRGADVWYGRPKNRED